MSTTASKRRTAPPRRLGGARQRNLITGEGFEVAASTEHAASNYGWPVWVTADGQEVGEVRGTLLGFEVVKDWGSE